MSVHNLSYFSKCFTLKMSYTLMSISPYKNVNQYSQKDKIKYICYNTMSLINN